MSMHRVMQSFLHGLAIHAEALWLQGYLRMRGFERDAANTCCGLIYKASQMTELTERPSTAIQSHLLLGSQASEPPPPPPLPPLGCQLAADPPLLPPGTHPRFPEFCAPSAAASAAAFRRDSL